MSMLAINAPERVNKILAVAKGTSNKEYLMVRTAECLNKKIAQSEITPRISAAELIAYISASYTGIQSTCIIQTCVFETADFMHTHNTKSQSDEV